MDRGRDGQRRNGQRRNGQRKNRHRSNTATIVTVLVAILFYFSIDDRLSNRTREPQLFDSFEGPWADNNDLFASEKVYHHQINGPESLAEYKGNFYTGTFDGQIVRVDGVNELKTIISLGPDSCRGKVNVKSCGRPLGVRITSSGDLYTVDAFNGLVKVTNIDETSGSKPEFKYLFNISSPVNGNASVFLDDLVVDESSPEGKVIYMTDASLLWDLGDVVASVMDLDDSGRILRYTESTGLVDLVLDGLAFPNGIELTDSRDALLIAEFTHKRILKYYFNGTVEVLINLPGEPDNIRRSARTDKETYWIAVFSPRTKPSWIDYFSERPLARKILITAVKLFGSLLSTIGDILDHQPLKDYGRATHSLWHLADPKGRSMALEIDSTGEVINCLHSNDGYIHSISEIHDKIDENGQRTLYLGSFTNNYLGVLTLNKV